MKRLYQPLDQTLRLVPPVDAQSFRSKFDLRLVTNILEMGQIPKLLFPKHDHIRNNESKIPFWLGAVPIKSDLKIGVSFDENAEKLAQQYLPGNCFWDLLLNILLVLLVSQVPVSNNKPDFCDLLLSVLLVYFDD